MKHYILALLCFISPFLGERQSVDSLKNILTANKDHYQLIATLNQLGKHYESISDYPKSLFYLNRAKKINSKNQFPKQAIFTLNYLGYVYWHKSEYDKSLFYHQKALKVAKEKNINDENLAFTYLMLGNDHYDKGDFNQTSHYYFKCIKLAESIKDTSIRIQGHNRLSKLYFKMKDYKLSLEHVSTAFRLNKKTDLRELAVSYNSFGNISLAKENIDSALFYFRQTLLNFQRCGDVIGQSIASINLGDSYITRYEIKKMPSNLDSSYHYYEQSYLLNSSVDNKFGMIYGWWGMADVGAIKGNYSMALSNYGKALKLSVEIGAKSEELHLYEKLHNLYDKKGETDSSLLFLKKHISLKNRVESSEQAKQLLRQESKYEFEKLIAQEQAEIEKEKLIESEKNKWKNVFIMLVISVAIILLFVTYTSIKRLKIIRSKNKLINKINEELNHQKQEIIDSINYAKRIQNAILPPLNVVKEFLPENFILYMPKDIVAGDFYWLTSPDPSKKEEEKLILFAAADCTGHGVPGAMVSVVCNNGLNQSVREHGLTDPGKILDKTREIIISEFEKSDDIVKDGMDISLCSLKLKKQGTSNPSQTVATLQWAGANNPLWIFRQKKLSGPDPEPLGIDKPVSAKVQNDHYQLIELKHNKQSIGKEDNPQPFTTHSVELLKNDTIYSFTDGFQDQFGGERGKKFKAGKLKELLLGIQNKTMDEQKQIIFREFEDWKGELEQVDDVCIIGVRV